MEKGFIKLYHGELSWLGEKMKCSATTRVVYHLIENSEMGSNCVHIGYGESTRIMVDLQISRPTYFKAMKELQDKGIIVKVCNGEYIVSPHIIWQGDEELRKIAIKDFDERLCAYFGTIEDIERAADEGEV